MSLIDEEFEAISEDDLKVIMKTIEEAVERHTKIIDKLETVTLEELSGDDPEFKRVTEAVRRFAGDMVDQATDKVIGRYQQNARDELKALHQVMTKLHLLKSRI